MTAPWLAPDGRPWLARRLSINLIGTGPLARAALWALHRP